MFIYRNHDPFYCDNVIGGKLCVSVAIGKYQIIFDYCRESHIHSITDQLPIPDPVFQSIFSITITYL